MFGAVNVQPATAEYYRSQVTNEELKLATKGSTIDYNARYPNVIDPKHPNRSCAAPILKMVDIQRMVCDANGKNCVCKENPNVLQLYSSDLTALITGPNAGPFTPAPGPVPPEFAPVASSPDRTQPWREFTIIYHEVPTAVQAFQEFYPLPAFQTTLSKAITKTSTTPITVAAPLPPRNPNHTG